MKKNITEQIVSGSIRINSTEEFERFLKLFPNDPELIKAYADLLSKKKCPDSALKLYRKAAILFLGSGSMIDAVASKIRQWKIAKPADQDGLYALSSSHLTRKSSSRFQLLRAVGPIASRRHKTI